MTVFPIPAEPSRYWVTSRTRAEIQHIVDMDWVECPGDMARPMCSCEESLIKGNICAHIKAVESYLKGHE